MQFGGSLNSLAATIVPILVGYLMGNAANADQRRSSRAVDRNGHLRRGVLRAGGGPHSRTQKIQDAKRVAEKKDKHSPISFRHFVLGTVAIFIYVGVEVGIPNVPTWLQTTDLNVLGSGVNVEAIAGSVAATYWLLMLIGRFAGGLLGAKVSAKSDADGRQPACWSSAPCSAPSARW